MTTHFYLPDSPPLIDPLVAAQGSGFRPLDPVNGEIADPGPINLDNPMPRNDLIVNPRYATMPHFQFLGCVIPCLGALWPRGEFTQPSLHLLAEYFLRQISSLTHAILH